MENSRNFWIVLIILGAIWFIGFLFSASGNGSNERLDIIDMESEFEEKENQYRSCISELRSQIDEMSQTMESAQSTLQLASDGSYDELNDAVNETYPSLYYFEGIPGSCDLSN